MLRPEWRIAAVCTMLLTLAVTAAAGLPRGMVLAFEYGNTGRILDWYPVADQAAFAIVYTHSIHLTPVEEAYAIRGGFIVQESIAYESYGIGMPANAVEGERFDVEDGRYVVSGLNRAFREVDMRVARVTASQELAINGERIAFASFARPGAWIRMRVRTVGPG